MDSALAKEKERDWWNIGVEVEVEKLEVSGPWSGTRGDSVEPRGEMGHKSDRTKVTREEEEKEKLKEDEMEVDADAPQGESVETKSSKRKVIRVESEERQDYVRGILAISLEEAEELAFVPSAISELRGQIHFRIGGGGRWRSPVNLCQQCVQQRADGAARQAEVEFVAMGAEKLFAIRDGSWE